MSKVTVVGAGNVGATCANAVSYTHLSPVCLFAALPML